MQQQRWADAEPVFRECVAAYRDGQPGAVATLHALMSLGTVLMRQGKWSEAEPHLTAGYWGLHDRRESLRSFEAAPFLSGAADRLIELYTAWGKPNEAAKWRAERAKYPAEGGAVTSAT
jgi:hypothetical protein